MYKPPINSNRVKSIKNKFENIENQKEQCSSRTSPLKNGIRNDLRQIPVTKCVPLCESALNNNRPPPLNTKQEYGCLSSSKNHPILNRQLSDPQKCNIKRTPAFRVDKNFEKACGFQRNTFDRNTLYETKVKQFNCVKTCDKIEKECNEDNCVNVSVCDNSVVLNCVSQSTSSKCCSSSSSNFVKQRSFVSDVSYKKKLNNVCSNKPTLFDKNTQPSHDSESSNLRSGIKTDLKVSNSPLKKPVLLKSKSSHDFQYIRNKFNKESILSGGDICNDVIVSSKVSQVQEKPQNQVPNLNKTLSKGDAQNMDILDDIEESLLLKHIDLSLVYTEPIPKSLRNKQSSESSSSNTESPLFQPKIDNIYTKSTLKLTDTDKREFLESLKQVLQQDIPGGITDSLKVALNKPLPGGPAPKKPPRTFQHCVEAALASNIEKNPSFLHIAKEVEKRLSLEKKNGVKKTAKKGDPKYMLNRLETALRNNKLRARKQQKIEVSTTSGEDSDDSLLFRSKSCRTLPKPPPGFHDSSVETTTNFGSFSESLLGDFNCFNSFSCTNPAYEKIKEPNSSFFVDKEEDPIYDEPITRKSSVKSKQSVRNSLYYMSTALIGDNGQNGVVHETSAFQEGLELKMDDNTPTYDPLRQNMELTTDEGKPNCGTSRQMSAEDSSLSSFTSDLDSNPSPVTDDPHAKIRCLIQNFEARRRQTLPKERTRQERIQDPSDSTNRVEILKNSLRLTLDRTFSDVVLPVSKDAGKLEKFGVVANMVAKFHTYQRSAPKYQQPVVNTDTLFYCCLVVEKVQDCAQIKFQFPPQVKIPKDIESLCFPESLDTPPLEGTSAVQTYSLLITSEFGERTYGYCRRVLPEGSTHCLPLAYCILSKYRAPRFYKKLLTELESRHGMQNRYRDELISRFYHKPFPKPGESVIVNLSFMEPNREENTARGLDESLSLTSYIHGKRTEAVFVNKTGEYGTLSTAKSTSIFVSENDIKDACLAPTYVAYEGNKTELVLTLHPDTRYEDADLKRLHKLPPDILLKIFSSLLLERKVILISSVISELSSCVDSLQSILYPFTWYHTFIPILPESLWDIIESPTPVVCGVLSFEAFNDRRIENGIVVNLDTQSVLFEEGDEMKILSGSMQKTWRQFMALANKTKSKEYIYSVYLADAYLCVFISFLKNYKQYLVDGQFLKEEFIKNAKTKGIRRFLKMFTETCMFHAFMDMALHNSDSLATFDKKIELYGSDESQVILDKLMDWNRQ